MKVQVSKNARYSLMIKLLLFQVFPFLSPIMSGFGGKSAEANACFDGYLVIDFAVTSLKDMKINPQEIIEMAVHLIEAKTFAVSAKFIRYVKPLHRIKLTPFCTKTTGERGKFNLMEPVILSSKMIYTY